MLTRSKLLKKPKPIKGKPNDAKTLSEPGNIKETRQKLQGAYLYNIPQTPINKKLLGKLQRFAPKKKI